MIFGREIFSVRTQISMKAPVCGGNFPSQVIGWSILATSENRDGGVCNAQHRIKKHTRFYMETLNWEKLREEEKALL